MLALGILSVYCNYRYTTCTGTLHIGYHPVKCLPITCTCSRRKSQYRYMYMYVYPGGESLQASNQEEKVVSTQYLYVHAEEYTCTCTHVHIHAHYTVPCTYTVLMSQLHEYSPFGAGGVPTTSVSLLFCTSCCIFCSV